MRRWFGVFILKMSQEFGSRDDGMHKLRKNIFSGNSVLSCPHEAFLIEKEEPSWFKLWERVSQSYYLTAVAINII
ncbi:MAG: hypothetical protein A2Z73_04725 [Deltaproteobacteria bacterium RBG_13_60_28]|jgi:hypothetical protein|nr:MAG: hypothetical protein A2Z73_04725 [Deltaproteobacteria bacterium RBG_13_60_28]